MITTKKVSRLYLLDEIVSILEIRMHACMIQLESFSQTECNFNWQIPY